jgi:N-acetylmuramic acid 6-phosphate (MurNAc-6-P) etherase
VMQKTGLDRSAAEKRLVEAGGLLRKAIQR